MRSVDVDYWIKSKPSLHRRPFGQSVLSIWDTSQEFSDSFISTKKSRRVFEIGQARRGQSVGGYRGGINETV